MKHDRWCDRWIICMPIHYCLVTSEAAYYEECTRRGVPRIDQGSWISLSTSHATTSFLNAKDGTRLAIVAINDYATRTGPQIAGLLVHEAVHIFQEYCERVGELKPSSEFQAYSIQWIAQELMEQYSAQVVKPSLGG